MKNYSKIILSALILMLPIGLFSWDKNEALKAVEESESGIVKLELNEEINDFIPHDLYSDAVINSMNARNYITPYDDGELSEEDVNAAYYYAIISLIKLQAAEYRARARKLHMDYLLKNSSRESSTADQETPADAPPPSQSGGPIISLFEAGLVIKNNTFKADLLDRDILTSDGTELSRAGRERLAKIALVLKIYSGATIQVIGHTSRPDRRELSASKARMAAAELEKHGIASKRIKTAGLGNSVVMYTPFGYRRVDRTEVVISGIDLR